MGQVVDGDQVYVKAAKKSYLYGEQGVDIVATFSGYLTGYIKP